MASGRLELFWRHTKTEKQTATEAVRKQRNTKDGEYVEQEQIDALWKEVAVRMESEVLKKWE